MMVVAAISPHSFYWQKVTYSNKRGDGSGIIDPQ